MASYYSSQCFTGPPSLITLSESAVVKLLLSKTRSTYNVTLDKVLTQEDDQPLKKCVEILNCSAELQYTASEYQKIIPLMSKKEDRGYISDLVQIIRNFVFWIFGNDKNEIIERNRIFGNNSSDRFERERCHLRLEDIMNHQCDKPAKESLIYVEREGTHGEDDDFTSCNHRIRHGAYICKFPLEVTITSLTANFFAYYDLFKMALPLNISSRLLQNAMNKLTGRYVLNVTYEDFYYWCEKFFLILALARYFSKQGMEVAIFDMDYGAACAIMAWLEELQLTNEISTLKLFFRSPSTYIFGIPKCSFFNINLSIFKHLHTLSLDFCDCKTLRHLRHCSLRSLSIRSYGMKDTVLLNDFLGVKDTSSVFLQSGEWTPSKVEIVGSNLSSSLQYLALPISLSIICEHHAYMFPNLREYVTPHQRYKLNRSRQLLVKTVLVLDCIPDNREIHARQMREQDLEQQVKEVKELDLGIFTSVTQIKDRETVDMVRKYCNAPFLSKLNLNFFSKESKYRVSAANELSDLFPYLENTLSKVSNLHLGRFKITAEIFHKLSLLENLEELKIAISDKKVEYNACCRYFPSLTKVSLELRDDILPNKEAIRCLFSGGQVQTMYITLSYPRDCQRLKDKMVSSLICKHLCSLNHLSIDVDLLSRPFFEQLRLLPHLQTFTFILTNEKLLYEHYESKRTDFFLEFLDYVPSHINACVSTDTQDLNKDSILIWRF